MDEKLKTSQSIDAETKQWFVYMLRCGDGSLYTGITLDVDRRLQQHSGEMGVRKGAKSLRGKLPLSIAYSVTQESRSAALKLEYKIKQLTKRDKEELVSGSKLLSQLVE